MIDYSNMLSHTVQELKPSGIRKFFDMLADMGDDVVALTVGQPDFVTPWHIREAAIDALEKGKTYYTSNAGMPELRTEISRYMRRKFELDYQSDEVVVTVGGSEAIDMAIRSLVNPGDEVIIPMPSFVCYEPIARMCGAKVVVIDTKVENSFKLTPDELRAAITDKTKLLILPFPNNPTGAILDKSDLEALAEVLRDTNIVILSDEIYAELTYGKTHVSIASIEGMKERTVIASGFSKAYAMTGWRLGYICAPLPLAQQMLKLHQFAIMCAPTASQFAAIEAMKNGDEDIEYMRSEYNRRRTFILDGLRKIGLECFEPEGAFYIYPKISGFGLTSEEFCERLLFEHKCAIVPGTAFGDCGEGFARISYAYSLKHIAEALKRIEKFVSTLRAENK